MAKKKATVAEPSAMVMDTPVERALSKAKDPNMTLAGNPLAADEDYVDGRQEYVMHTNMERLYQDVHLRRGPNGHIYSAIMGNRYGG